jgi:hypothetical protein
MRGDFLALVDDQIGRLAHDDAGKPHRAGGMRAAALLDDVGVALVDIDVVERHAEPFRHALRKGRLVALPADSVPTTTSTRPCGCTVMSARSRG